MCRPHVHDGVTVNVRLGRRHVATVRREAPCAGTLSRLLRATLDALHSCGELDRLASIRDEDEMRARIVRRLRGPTP